MAFAQEVHEDNNNEATPYDDLLTETDRWMTYDASGRVIYEEIEASTITQDVIINEQIVTSELLRQRQCPAMAGPR